MTTTKAYRVKGTTADVTACGLCGREDLARTVVLAELDADGNEQGVTYMGTDCAARAAKWTQATVRKLATAADREAREAEARARQAEHDAFMAAYSLWLQEHYGVRQPSDLKGVSPLAVLREYRAETAA